jgi:hypothetical protein
MQIVFEKNPENERYQSLLIVNARKRWKETLYFTLFTPWGEEKERLYAGRYMSDVHFHKKECECVLAFDFHRWDEQTVKEALSGDLPRLSFAQYPLDEIFNRALEERERQPEGFSIKYKG